MKRGTSLILRTKGSKNRPKFTTNSISTTDFASRIAEKQSAKDKGDLRISEVCYGIGNAR